MMKKINLLKTTMGILTLQFAFADNPISSYHYLADPTAVVVGDSIFYIISDLDDESVTGYDIKAYYLFSSKDMKNWTDHGEIFRVPRDVSWANNAWAPAAAWRDGKMYIYFPNGGSGVGVVSSSNPAGPYTDPIGGPLINPGRGECDGIAWCFDPGVFVDDDGQGYLIWGGGENTNRPFGNNFSMVKLNANMTSWSGNIMKMSGMNKSFEAPYITKRNGVYYLSYNSTSQTIDYATSNSPMGPWNYKGTVLANPNINGQNINAYNNNHHGFAEFKGKWYAAYHDRRLANANGDPTPEWHRNLSIDELQYNTDGTFKSVVFTHQGPSQVANFNPYNTYPATTSSLQKNVRSLTVPVNNSAPYSMLIPKPQQNGGSWIRLSNVDFGSGALTFKTSAASLNGNNKVEIRSGSATGTLAGTCNLASTGSWNSYTESECSLSGLSGVVNELYINFTGSDSTAGLIWWSFSSSPPIPQGPYDSLNVAKIPGTIEMENYDVGGEGKAYHDLDAANQGNTYRTDAVDITGSDSTGYQIGWTSAGEWTEYTVNVDSTAAYDWEARVSAGLDGASFRLLIDSTEVTQTVSVPNTSDWNTYTTVTGSIEQIAAGKHILRLLVEGSYFNIDWIRFTPRDGAVKSQSLNLESQVKQSYRVYDLKGLFLGSIEVNSSTPLKAVIHEFTSESGVYLLRSPNGQVIKTFVNSNKRF